MFAVPSFFGYNTTFVSTPVATAATGVGSTSFTANWNAFIGASYYLLDVSTSSSFSSFVGSYQNFVVLSTSQLVSGLTASTTYYYRLRAATGVDADAAAFFSRVYTAGGALSYTEVSATETLVSSLKANSLWTPMKAIYPMIGASAAACAQNLKSASFTGTFTSGWTFASTGVTGNGTSAYMNTGLNPSVSLAFNSRSHAIYSRTNTTLGGVQIDSGCYDATSEQRMSIDINLFGWHGFLRFSAGGNVNNTATQRYDGFFIGTRTSTVAKLFRQNSSLGQYTPSGTHIPNQNIYLGAVNAIGIADSYCNREYSFFSISDGLSDTDVSNFTTINNTFQTTLSRNV